MTGNFTQRDEFDAPHLAPSWLFVRTPRESWYALGNGALRHGMLLPVAVGGIGLGVMAGAMTLDHGVMETAYTIAGVSILAFGHELNRRSFW